MDVFPRGFFYWSRSLEITFGKDLRTDAAVEKPLKQSHTFQGNDGCFFLWSTLSSFRIAKSFKFVCECSRRFYFLPLKVQRQYESLPSFFVAILRFLSFSNQCLLPTGDRHMEPSQMTRFCQKILQILEFFVHVSDRCLFPTGADHRWSPQMMTTDDDHRTWQPRATEDGQMWYAPSLRHMKLFSRISSVSTSYFRGNLWKNSQWRQHENKTLKEGIFEVSCTKSKG